MKGYRTTKDGYRQHCLKRKLKIGKAPIRLSYIFEDEHGRVSSGNYSVVKSVIGKEKVWLSCYVNGIRYMSTHLNKKPSIDYIKRVMYDISIKVE